MFVPSDMSLNLQEVTKNDKYYDSGGFISNWQTVGQNGEVIESSFSQDIDKYSLIPNNDNVGGLYLCRQLSDTPSELGHGNGDLYSLWGVNWSGVLKREREVFASNGTTGGVFIQEFNFNYPYESLNSNAGLVVFDYPREPSEEEHFTGYFDTNLPIFDWQDSVGIEKYRTDGDISNAINRDELGMGDVYTRVYVDKSTPPNLKFTWNINEGYPPSIYNISIRGKLKSLGGGYIWASILETTSSGSFTTTWGMLESKIPTAIKVLAPLGKIENIEVTFSIGGRKTLPITVSISMQGDYSPISENKGRHHLICYKGTGENDEGFVDDDYIDGVDDSTATDSNVTTNTNSLLTKTYRLTDVQLKSLGNFLWSADLFDNLKLINNNPIDNIVSCKAIPIYKIGNDTTLSLGNVNSGISCVEISSNYYKTSIGKIRVPRIYNNFVDFDYTQIYLYLPLIGTITDLNPSEVCGYEIELKYVFDIISGDCLAMVFNNRGGGENCIGTYKGNCGVDIPLSASNRAQLEVGYVSDAINGATSIMTKDASGVINSGLSALSRQFVTRSNGGVNGVTSQGLPRKAFLTVIENITQVPSNYASTYGRPCNLTCKLGNLSGFTVCDENIRLSNINCTETEKEEIKELLTKGVIL